jgi:hypothetical protein
MIPSPSLSPRYRATCVSSYSRLCLDPVCILMDLYHRSFVPSSSSIRLSLHSRRSEAVDHPSYSSLLLVVWNPNANMTILVCLTMIVGNDRQRSLVVNVELGTIFWHAKSALRARTTAYNDTKWYFLSSLRRSHQYLQPNVSP